MLAFVDARQVNLSVCSAFKPVFAYLGLEISGYWVLDEAGVASIIL